MKLTSSAFPNEGAIPQVHTCEGRDLAPPLAWSAVPDGAKSLALIVDDPDAPDPRAPKRTWVHWVVFDLPVSAGGLPEGGALPEGAKSGQNDWGREGYGGPCPPIGRHRYFFKLYALDTAIGDREALKKSDLERLMKDHVLADATLMGTYEKTG